MNIAKKLPNNIALCNCDCTVERAQAFGEEFYN